MPGAFVEFTKARLLNTGQDQINRLPTAATSLATRSNHMCFEVQALRLAAMRSRNASQTLRDAALLAAE